MSNRESNTEFLTRVMEFASSGPLMQVFVIQALDQYSKQVAGMTVEELTKQFDPNHWVAPAGWHACATELQRELQERLK